MVAAYDARYPHAEIQTQVEQVGNEFFLGGTIMWCIRTELSVSALPFNTFDAQHFLPDL